MRIAMAQMAVSTDMDANFKKSYAFVRQAAGCNLLFILSHRIPITMQRNGYGRDKRES